MATMGPCMCLRLRAACPRLLVLTAALAAGGLSPFVPSAAAQEDVISRASPAWDPGAMVTAGGSLDSEPVRSRNRIRLGSDDTPVLVLRGQGPLDLGQRICEATVPRRPPETPVLIKPNLGGFDWFKVVKAPGDDDGIRGRITQPEFVRGVIRCLKARGHRSITVADGWDADLKSWYRFVKVSGYEQMAREEGVRLTLMNDDGEHDVEDDKPGKPIVLTRMDKTGVPTLMLPKLLVEHIKRGLYVSVPRLKAHRFAVISGGIKGNQGVVMTSDAAPAYHQKGRLHREIDPYLKARKQGLPEGPDERARYVAALEAFAGRMVDVLEVAAPDAVLLDAAPGMAGDGFQQLWPQADSVAVGGTNAVRVDRVGAQILGLWDSAALAKELGGHRTSPLIEAAAQRFKLDLAATRLAGDGAGILSQPRPVHYVAMAPFAIHSDAALPLYARPGTVTVPTAPPSAPAPSAPPPPAGLPIARAAALGKDVITVDGRGDEAAWSRAPAVEWTTDYAGRPTSTLTRVRFLWARDALYLLWELEGADLNVDASHPVAFERKDLYTEDCVELLVAPRPEELSRFFEIELGPRGHFYDLAINMKARPRENPAWSGNLLVRAVATPERRRAVIEVAVRAPEITRLLTPGAEIPIALYRTEGKAPRIYLSWRPARTPKPNFHVPEGFGALILQ